MQNKTCATNECGKLISLMQSEKNFRKIKEKKKKKHLFIFRYVLIHKTDILK